MGCQGGLSGGPGPVWEGKSEREQVKEKADAQTAASQTLPFLPDLTKRLLRTFSKHLGVFCFFFSLSHLEAAALLCYVG